MAAPKFPLDYKKVFLVDELLLRAYLAQLRKFHHQPGKALAISKKMQDLLREADYKRKALFSEDSVNDSFSIVKHIYNTGMFGRILAELLTKYSVNPHK